jgi:hypothetical protein
MLPNPIRNRRKRSSTLTLTCLENRLTPAVSAFFDSSVGALQLSIDDDASTGQNVRVVAIGGLTKVVNDTVLVPIDTPLGTSAVPAKAIRSISINGSSLGNRIDLYRVGPMTFPRLDGAIILHGGAGSDTIVGSQHSDRIWGHDGRDVISGQNGNDWLNAGSGQDTIHGLNGDDHIELNDGEHDVAFGGLGENTETSDSLDNLSEFLPRGVRGEYFTDGAFDNLGKVRVDPTINFDWGQNPPYTGDPQPPIWTDNLNQSWYVHYTVRWTGRIVPKYSETYNFHLTVDDGAMLYINDQLIVDTWKEQGPTEYTGQINLSAGEPARFKLLYFNGWFGATAKLKWSSASQAKEIIPTSQLLLPERETAPSAALVASLAGRFTAQTIALPAAVKYQSRGGWGDRPNTILAPLTNGGYKLGWNDTNGDAHITTFDAASQIIGTDIILPDLDLRGLVAHDDGYVGVMAARNNYQMVVIRLDPAGSQVFETILTGINPDPTQSTHLDTLWCYRGRFMTSGTEYAVHFAHIQQQGHQGGYYATIDFAGNKTKVNGWTVSHSLDQRLLYHRGQWFSMSLGDTFPKGLQLENRTLGRGKVIFPSSAMIGAWKPESANLGSMVSAGKNIGLIVASQSGASKELFYLLVDTEGRVLKTIRLTNTPTINESIVRMIPFGKNLLIAWQVSPTQTKVAVINYDGKVLNMPAVVNQPLPGNDELVSFPNGDVGWLVAKHGEASLSVVRVRV